MSQIPHFNNSGIRDAGSDPGANVHMLGKSLHFLSASFLIHNSNQSPLFTEAARRINNVSKNVNYFLLFSTPLWIPIFSWIPP